MSNGPDINGQPARLRAADGINLARPGKRKVAFYAEKPLYKLLGIDPAAPAAQRRFRRARPIASWAVRADGAAKRLPTSTSSSIPTNSVRSIRPVRLRCARRRWTAASNCSGMVAEPRHEARTPAEKLAIEGIAPAPVAGRADQFAWPQLASAATAMRAMNIDRTTEQDRGAVGPAGSGRGYGRAARRPFRRSHRAAARSAASRAAGDPAGPAGGDLAGPGCARDRRRAAAAGDAGDDRQGDRA